VGRFLVHVLERIVTRFDPGPVPESPYRERDRERDRRNGSTVLAVTACLTSMLLLPWSARAADLDLTGRISPQAAVTTYPSNSVFTDVFGSSSVDTSFDARVVFGFDRGGFNLDIDYQLIGVWADRLELSRELPPVRPDLRLQRRRQDGNPATA
jgi:hypothetical protein